LLFIFCSLKALPNIRLFKKPPYQSHHNSKILNFLAFVTFAKCLLFERILENILFNTRIKQRLMLDYLTAGIAFWMTLFGVQESLLEFRLGYLGRY
jgi:hypothetical protein